MPPSAVEIPNPIDLPADLRNAVVLDFEIDVFPNAVHREDYRAAVPGVPSAVPAREKTSWIGLVSGKM